MENSRWKVPIMIEKVFCVRVCVKGKGASPKQCVYGISAALCTNPCVAQIKGILLTKTQIRPLHKGSFSKVHQSVGAERREGDQRTERDWNWRQTVHKGVCCIKVCVMYVCLKHTGGRQCCPSASRQSISLNNYSKHSRTYRRFTSVEMTEQTAAFSRKLQQIVI